MAKLMFEEGKITTYIDQIVRRTFDMDFDWDWPGGVAFYGIAEAYEITKKEDYLLGLKTWMDDHLEGGLPPLSINGVSMGHTLLFLFEHTGEEVYLETAEQLADYVLKKAPRFADGILQHTVNSTSYVFPEQAWADTLMMAGLFMLKYGVVASRQDCIDDALKQYHGHEEFLQDQMTHLYYHGWDHQAQNHLSGIYWGRANAWAALTMAKALPLIPVTHPSFMIIDGSLRDQLSALVRLQGESGLWHTILDDPTSYLEVSASCGIASALISRGHLYNKQIQQALSGVLAAVKEDGSVTGVSAGTAIMEHAEGYKKVPIKRIQGWGQGLALVFLTDVLRTRAVADTHA
ncbi:glycoside hydrolase family 88/105 protein [Bacillus sp. NPDC077027]|uniref:glycoside hydrolase family 88/105 protein n=1 Tax=Bacillus sp. NPDC077027 TaxID=3390548 RepID=UPI003CFEB107